MAAGLERPDRGGPGGILSLCLLLFEHGEAIEFDLLRAGHNLADLGTLALSWRDLWVLVRGWKRTPGSALQEAIFGTVWDIQTQLLAEVVDLLAIANWQRGGRKNAPRPKRIPRPWEKARSQTIGADPIPISQFDDWWDAQEPRAA